MQNNQDGKSSSMVSATFAVESSKANPQSKSGASRHNASGRLKMVNVTPEKGILSSSSSQAIMRSLEDYEKEYTSGNKKDEATAINDEDLNYFEKKYELPA